jgi:hypothetical protein
LGPISEIGCKLQRILRITSDFNYKSIFFFGLIIF